MYMIYKTTNLITGEYYIGVHKCNNPYYFGSGLRIKRSIKKYGKKHFIRETVLLFETANEAFQYEKVLLDTCLNDIQCLNLSEGGRGGSNFSGKKHSEETKRKIAESVRKTNPSRVWSEEQKRRFSEIAIEKNYIARLQKYGREDKVDKSPVS